MKAGRSCLLLFLLVLFLGSCSESSGPNGSLKSEGDAAVARALVQQVRARFKALAPQFDRAMAMERSGAGFRFRPPEAATTHAPGTWRQAGNHRMEADLPARATGVMRLSSGPVTLEVRALGATDMPGELTDRALVYRDAYPHSDSLFVAEQERVEEYIFLRDARAPRRFVYELRVVRGGGRVRQNAGVVEVLDGVDNAWLRLVEPFMVDREGQRHEVQASLERGTLTLTLPAGNWKYPALLDPGWTTTGSMSKPRRSHTATLLGSGKVLVAGGNDGSTNYSSAELYDPATGTWTTTGSMSTARYDSAATLLGSGKVLVAGGNDGSTYLSSAELYNPATGKWATTGSINTGRHEHTATLMGSGKVLVAGGSGGGSSAELYDPAKGTWTATGSMNQGRRGHTATLLKTGKVLVAGGYKISSTEVYDLVTGTWTTTGSMNRGRGYHTATLLKAGKVLVAGGWGITTKVHSSTEIYDPAAGTWTTTGSLAGVHELHTATLLGSGKVLIAGGSNGTGVGFKSAELYEPGSGTWTATRSMKEGRLRHQATLLSSGKVLVTGGFDNTKMLSSAELFDPTHGLPCTSASQCKGGYCTDGICCESSCSQTCKACAVSNGLGKCQFVAKGKQDPGTCAATGKACDGAGACKKENGQSCATGSDCVNGYCADYICCDSACQGTCMACNLTGSAGKCVKVPLGQQDQSAASPCTNPSACDGNGVCKLSNGQACGVGSQCASGNCMDYVCCDNACQGTCMTCSLAGKKGTCSYVQAGQTDGNATTPCSGGKVCDGKGSCRVAPGQPCKLASDCSTGFCVDGVCCKTACAAACWTCAIPGTGGACTALPAGSTDLKATTPCLGKQACDGAGKCKTANGQFCSLTSTCASGFCADNACCESLCIQTCKSCAVKGSEGKCINLPLGQQDANATSPCKGLQACDGKGKCKAANGQKCIYSTECASGNCADGVCCDSACTETCKTCDGANTSGAAGACSNITVLFQDKNATVPCIGSQACDGNGTCKAGVGETCKDNKDCANSTCSDKVCCKTPCKGNCMSCNLTGSVGTCAPDPVGTKSSDCGGTDPACGGKCDGKGNCDYPTATQSCGKSTDRCKACDGKGDCNRAPKDDSACGTIDCDKLDTKCRDYHDLTTERCESFGKCKAPNDPKSCTLYSDVSCTDAVVPDQGADMEAGVRPDQGQSPSAPDEGGCNCDLGSSPGGLAGGLVHLLIIGLAWSRRRRAGGT